MSIVNTKSTPLYLTTVASRCVKIPSGDDAVPSLLAWSNGGFDSALHGASKEKKGDWIIDNVTGFAFGILSSPDGATAGARAAGLKTSAGVPLRLTPVFTSGG